MKRRMISAVAAMLAVSAVAQVPESETRAVQEPETERVSQDDSQLRSLKLMVRGAKGRVMRDLTLVAQIKGDGKAETLDRFGNRFFDVTDADTLILVASGNVYEFPVAGLDSLHVVFRNKNKIAGVAVRDRIVDTGYSTYSERDKVGAAEAVDMTGAGKVHYRDLRDFIEGRVSGVQFWGDNLVVRGLSTEGALIVVDGVPKRSFSDANASVHPMDVGSITVLKDAAAAVYGVQGGNGVVVITTKRGQNL